MTTEIYYFSGTGNSLFVARELKKKIPDSRLIPIASLMNRDKIVTHGTTVGFVFPVHALTIPIVIKKFLKKLDATSAEYVFAIATRVGTKFYGFEKIDQLLKKSKKRLSSQFILEMYGNDSRHGNYPMPKKADILALEKKVLEELKTIEKVILQKEISHKKDTKYSFKTAQNPIAEFFLDRLVLFAMSIAEYFGGANYFYHDEKCIGCGICEKVCLSKKISMQDKKPVWDKNTLCYMCFACLNFCPKKSVQIHSIPGVKSYSTENERYTHPYAEVKDIAEQKKQ